MAGVSVEDRSNRAENVIPLHDMLCERQPVCVEFEKLYE